MRLFGSSGIRGITNTEISVELVSKIGGVLGSLHKEVILGHDPRTSSPLMLHALTSGLLSTGCGVHIAGLVTTPTLAHAARNFSCGIMITASHNPPEYNGIKFFNPDGSGFNTPQMEEIESMMAENNIKPAEWESIKNTTLYQNAVEDHIQSILKHIPKLDLKIGMRRCLYHNTISFQETGMPSNNLKLSGRWFLSWTKIGTLLRKSFFPNLSCEFFACKFRYRT
jgi:phosphoglucosamine mutase